jgi:hypothetical protein
MVNAPNDLTARPVPASSTATARRPDWVAPLTVAVGWALASLLILGVRRPTAWDEAVYLAKGLGATEPISWGPQRALGMPLLTSLVTWWDLSVAAARLVLVATNAAVAFMAMWTWRRLVGPGGVIGPAVVLFSWLGLMSASEIYPNLPTAVLALWTVGATWTWTLSRRHLDAAAALVATIGLGLIRPTALAWLFFGYLVAVAMSPVVRRHRDRLLGGAAAASAVGVTPWMVESFLEFGGPVSRLQSGRDTIVGYEIGHRVTAFLATLSNQKIGTAVATTDTVILIGMLAVAVAAGAYGLWSVGASTRAALMVVTMAGAAKLVSYLLFPSTAAARFMLPALLMLSVPVGVGIAAAWAQRWGQAAVAVLTVGFVVWQVPIAREVGQHQTAQRQQLQHLGVALYQDVTDADGYRWPCRFESRHGHPPITLKSGCQGGSTNDIADSFGRLAQMPATVSTYVIWNKPVEPPEGWQFMDVPTPDNWWIYERSPGG